MEKAELKKIIETLLFITDEPLSSSRISRICETDERIVEEIIEDIRHSYDAENRALSVVKIAGGWQMATRQEYSLWVRKLYSARLTTRLSNAALEVLGIIAYKQPTTKAEIEAIRGVDSSGPIDTLLERKLITSVGRKEVIGRPIMYGTTDEFLKHFGLNSIEDLPKINDLVDENLLKDMNGKINKPTSDLENPHIKDETKNLVDVGKSENTISSQTEYENNSNKSS